MRKDKYRRHIQNCTGITGILYNFDTQNLITFEDNLKYKGDFPFVAYYVFKTTDPTDFYLDPENREMLPVSYIIIFAFYPNLQLDRIIIERPFGHNLSKLANVGYLNRDMLSFADLLTMKQLRDCATKVNKKNSRQAIAEMLTTELKFSGDCLMKWSEKKFKFKNLEKDLNKKIAYDKNNPVD